MTGTGPSSCTVSLDGSTRCDCGNNLASEQDSCPEIDLSLPDSECVDRRWAEWSTTDGTPQGNQLGCQWIAKGLGFERCTAVGTNGILAEEACPLTCGACGQTALDQWQTCEGQCDSYAFMNVRETTL